MQRVLLNNFQFRYRNTVGPHFSRHIHTTRVPQSEVVDPLELKNILFSFVIIEFASTAAPCRTQRAINRSAGSSSQVLRYQLPQCPGDASHRNGEFWSAKRDRATRCRRSGHRMHPMSSHSWLLSPQTSSRVLCAVETRKPAFRWHSVKKLREFNILIRSKNRKLKTKFLFTRTFFSGCFFEKKKIVIRCRDKLSQFC